MLEILHISENGLKANQEWINAISQNVANMQTAGYKKAKVSFSELVGRNSNINSTGEVSSTQMMGVQSSSNTIDFSKGDIKSTGRPLDIAIIGSGFIELELENGEFGYTKVGRLAVDQNGRLVAHDGSLLSSEIVVPSNAKSVQINSFGQVTANIDAGTTLDLGTINLHRFNNSEALEALGNEVYKSTRQSGEAELIANRNEGNTIMQGFLEMSNVNMIDEMSDLLLAQRAYQLNARIIQTADQILETINNLRR